ncbi:MAG: cysteine desulfurase family protein [Breznakia sp.]
MKQCKPKYYFDYASTTPIDEHILDSYTKVLQTYYANSQSVYALGLEVHQLVETSRKKIAHMLSVQSEEIIFTSGASEANSFAIKGFALQYSHRGKHIIANRMEHSSTLQALAQLAEVFSFDISYVDVAEDGRISLAEIQKHMRKDTILVCLMAVNNEIGSRQDIEAIGAYLKKNSRSAFFVDGVQQIGKYPLHLEHVDLYTWTTHKLYGVKGCGVLVKKKNISLLPLIHGGQQELGIRGGTLNAPACIVAAKTLRLAMQKSAQHMDHVRCLSNLLYDELSQLAEIDINSNQETCIPYIFNFSWTKMNSEIMMNALNERNIYISSQSACSSKTREPSHTLLALGYRKQRALATIRISLSHYTTKEEVEYLIQNIKEIVYEYTSEHCV